MKPDYLVSCITSIIKGISPKEDSNESTLNTKPRYKPVQSS